MHFVHTVRINARSTPSLEMLSREQVWRGLLRRAERPTEFLPQLKACQIVMRGDDTLVRELNFGAFVVRDRVRLEPMRQLSFTNDASPGVASGCLSISIEETSDHDLQLRFTYDIERVHSDGKELEEYYDRLLQSTYVETDTDSVQVIRRLALAGEL